MAMIANANKSHLSKAETERSFARLILIMIHRGIANNKEMAAAMIILFFSFLKIR